MGVWYSQGYGLVAFLDLLWPESDGGLVWPGVWFCSFFGPAMARIRWGSGVARGMVGLLFWTCYGQIQMGVWYSQGYRLVCFVDLLWPDSDAGLV